MKIMKDNGRNENDESNDNENEEIIMKAWNEK